MLRLAGLVFILIAFGAAANRGVAGEKVWSGLILATNEDNPTEAPPEIAKFKAKLENVFGYNQLELIGSHTELMDDPDEQWLIPSKDFCLRVMSKTKGKSGYTLKLRLYQQKKMLADFETKLGTNSPLFIRGPMCGGGQLIIVLVVK